MANPSLELTHYGKNCDLGLRFSVHRLSPDFRYMPPPAG